MDLGHLVAIVVAVLAVKLVLLALFWMPRPKGVSMRELLRIIPDVLLLRSVVVNRAAPLDVRIVLVGLLAWILSPIDLIPEFIPALGSLDDVVADRRRLEDGAHP